MSCASIGTVVTWWLKRDKFLVSLVRESWKRLYQSRTTDRSVWKYIFIVLYIFSPFDNLLSGKKKNSGPELKGLFAPSHECGGSWKLHELLCLGSASLWWNEGRSARLPWTFLHFLLQQSWWLKDLCCCAILVIWNAYLVFGFVLFCRGDVALYFCL